MSLASWKAEFYPMPADEVPAKDAAMHSLVKWIGLRKKNLARHGIYRTGNEIADENADYISIDDSSCALCVHYAKYKSGWSGCKGCPLYEVRGGGRCDKYMEEELVPPYTEFLTNGDPEPMIEWLVWAVWYEAAHKTGE